MPLSAPKPDAYFPEQDHLDEHHSEPKTSWTNEETHDVEAPVDHWHELPCQLDSASPEFGQAEDPDASFHEQLAALVRALETEEPKPQMDAQAAHAAAEVMDGTEPPPLKGQVSEDKTWLTESRLISLAALNSALDGRFRGFVAGLGASIAVGAAAFALAGGVEEPPAMSSLEAQDGPPVIAEAAESEASEMGANTHLPLRTTLPGDIASAQPETSEIGTTDEDVRANNEMAAIPGTMVEPVAETEKAPKPPFFDHQSAESAGSASPVAHEAKVEASNNLQEEPSEEVALSFETTVKATSEESAESMPPVTDGTSETEVAYAVKYANLRAGPNNSAAVLAIIPEGSPLEVVQCKQWCEVIAQGQRGWVYKDLIRGDNG